jgi:hypothetical protein
MVAMVVVITNHRLESCFALSADLIDHFFIFFNYSNLRKEHSSRIPKEAPLKSIYIDNIHNFLYARHPLSTVKIDK